MSRPLTDPPKNHFEKFVGYEKSRNDDYAKKLIRFRRNSDLSIISLDNFDVTNEELQLQVY